MVERQPSNQLASKQQTKMRTVIKSLRLGSSLSSNRYAKDAWTYVPRVNKRDSSALHKTCLLSMRNYTREQQKQGKNETYNTPFLLEPLESKTYQVHSSHINLQQFLSQLSLQHEKYNIAKGINPKEVTVSQIEGIRSLQRRKVYLYALLFVFLLWTEYSRSTGTIFYFTEDSIFPKTAHINEFLKKLSPNTPDQQLIHTLDTLLGCCSNYAYFSYLNGLEDKLLELLEKKKSNEELMKQILILLVTLCKMPDGHFAREIFKKKYKDWMNALNDFDTAKYGEIVVLLNALYKNPTVHDIVVNDEKYLKHILTLLQSKNNILIKVGVLLLKSLNSAELNYDCDNYLAVNNNFLTELLKIWIEMGSNQRIHKEIVNTLREVMHDLSSNEKTKHDNFSDFSYIGFFISGVLSSLDKKHYNSLFGSRSKIYAAILISILGKRFDTRDPSELYVRDVVIKFSQLYVTFYFLLFGRFLLKLFPLLYLSKSRDSDSITSKD